MAGEKLSGPPQRPDPHRLQGRCTPGRHTIVDCFSNFLVTGARRRVEAASRARQERILTPCKSALLVRAEPRAAIRASANDQKSFLAGVLLANYLLQMTRVPGVQRPRVELVITDLDKRRRTVSMFKGNRPCFPSSPPRLIGNRPGDTPVPGLVQDVAV